MIRKLLLPAVAIALLGGCMTGGYNYRQDRGDYYYGQPSVDYRYHGSPYGGYYDRYGYPGYSRYPYGYGGYYNQPFYNNPYYNHPYYPYRPRPPVVVVPRPGDDANPPPRPDDRDDNDKRPPWRNFNRRPGSNPPMVPSAPNRVGSAPRPPRVVAPRPRPRNEGVSRNEAVMRRARDKAPNRNEEP